MSHMQASNSGLTISLYIHIYHVFTVHSNKYLYSVLRYKDFKDKYHFDLDLLSTQGQKLWLGSSSRLVTMLNIYRDHAMLSLDSFLIDIRV